MGRPTEENSVHSLVSILGVGESVKIENKNQASIVVLVSTLKRKEEHKDKKFKIKLNSEGTLVERIK